MLKTLLGVSASLGDIITDDQKGYRLVMAYCLKVAHSCWGYQFAIITKADRLIVVLEKDILIDVQKTLSSQCILVEESLVYSNKEGTLVFPITGEQDIDKLLLSPPVSVLTRELFVELTDDDREPFSWPLRLVGQPIQSEAHTERLGPVRKQRT